MNSPLKAVVLSCVFAICTTGATRGAIRIAEEALSQATHQKFDYRQNMTAASRGDETAVRELFLFSRHTDAAGSFGHGVALVDLFQTVGEEMPARVARTLSPDDRQRVTQILEAGLAYGFRAEPEEFSQRYPLMASALQPAGFSLTWLLLVGGLVAFVALRMVRRRLQVKHVAGA